MVETVFKRLNLHNEELLRIMREIPRHLFVDSALREKANQDLALPLSHEQSISQPTIVALMTHELSPKKGDKILEIGTGSGYQTAILARYTPRLYTVERIPELSQKAQALLESMGHKNIIYKTGDGSGGWESWAPYNGILVAAGAPTAPDTLKRQLADGGRLIIPCGGRDSQRLLRIERRGDAFVETDLGDCRFVPLLGAKGFKVSSSSDGMP